MTGPEALRGLLVYAHEEALTLDRERVAKLIALAISELSGTSDAGMRNAAPKDGTHRSERGPGYLQ